MLLRLFSPMFHVERPVPSQRQQRPRRGCSRIRRSPAVSFSAHIGALHWSGDATHRRAVRTRPTAWMTRGLLRRSTAPRSRPLFRVKSAVQELVGLNTRLLPQASSAARLLVPPSRLGPGAHDRIVRGGSCDRHRREWGRPRRTARDAHRFSGERRAAVSARAQRFLRGTESSARTRGPSAVRWGDTPSRCACRHGWERIRARGAERGNRRVLRVMTSLQHRIAALCAHLWHSCSTRDTACFT